MITRQERREMRGFADCYARKYMHFHPFASEEEIRQYVCEEMQNEYGANPAMMLVIGKIILELVKAWRESRK